VVVKDQYLGMISEDLLLDAKSTSLIESLNLEKSEAFIDENQHFFEVLRVMNLYSTATIAVLNSANEFMGCVLLADIAQYFSNLGFVNAPGGILVLNISQNNYSLSQIARIIESDDIKVLALFFADNPENGLESFLTIKTNKTDLTRLIASLERFGYNIEAEFHESVFQNYEVERLEMLFKYLNI
jgi:hypothetical protein